MRLVLFALLLVACGASKGPLVSKSDLALVPTEWADTWQPQVDDAVQAKAAVVEASSAVASRERAVRESQGHLDEVDREIREAEKAQRAARKGSDPDALRSATERRTALLAERGDVERELTRRRAELRLAGAIHDRLEVEHQIAVRKLEHLRARGVRDAGGWIDLDRFTEALDAAEARLPPAQEAERAAKSAVALAEQR
ncbi:MAG: hypothetical protein EA397_00930 [Deltaproteobacteria bacterium]|nr:MAG: hypothetical protein EA397_00930 [Deltaproteobacteria bacterium]